MEEKNISKAKQKRLEAEKAAKRNKIIFTAVCILACVLVVVLIALAQKKNRESGSGSASITPQLVPDKVDKSNAYSAGLTKDGKIEGIGNISDYVTLKEDLELKVYSADYSESTNPLGVVVDQSIDYQKGMHVLEMIEFYADVNVYEPYYQTMRELYDFIYNDRYETYRKRYESNGLQLWETVYDFLKVTEDEYAEMVDSNAKKETIHYLVVQALVEKYGLSCTEQDKIDYCMAMNSKLASEADAKSYMASFGDPYMTQRTLEWKLAYALAKDAENIDGSLTDGLTDMSGVFSKCYYENGNVLGIGSLESYITPADYKEIAKSVSGGAEILDRFISESDFTEYEDYIKNKQTELAGTDSSDDEEGYSEEALDSFKKDIAVQYIYADAGLSAEKYENSFCVEQGLDPDKKEAYIFVNGLGCFNRKVMEYAVLDYLEKL